MALESIKKIKEAETASEERRREIVNQAKKIINDAHGTAKVSAEKIEKEALEKATLIKKDAAQKADRLIEQILSENKLSCDKMKNDVNANIDNVAGNIVERIVNSWQ